MSFQAGNAYITITPSMRGFQRSVARGIENSQLDGPASAVGAKVGQSVSRSAGAAVNFQAMGRKMQDFGRGMSDIGGQMARRITLPALGAAAAVGGITAALGWRRLTSIDSAQAQLRGLGYEADDVERISGSLVDALEGGMMTLGDATSAAAGAMAAGVKEGDELTHYIQMLDAAVVGGNGTFEEMNQIFSRTADLGYLNANNFDMMAQRMPGFSSAMQEHTGKSGEAFREMLNNGEISLDEFLEVVDDFGGDMATEYSKSWAGMVENTKNWVGILGAELLGGVFEDSKLAIGEFIEFLSSDAAAEWASDMGSRIGDAFQSVIEWVQSAIEWWTGLDGSTQRLIGTIAGIVVVLGPVLVAIGTAIIVVGKFVAALAFLVNPITWVIAGIAALVAGLVWFFTQTELGQTILERVWGAIKTATAAVVDWFIGTAWPALQSFWDGMVTSAGHIWEAIQAAWSGIKDVVGSVVDWFMNTALPFVQSVWEGIAAGADWLWGAVQTVFGYIQTAFSAVVTAIGWAWDNIGRPVFDAMGAVIDWLWTSIVQPVFGFIVAAWEGLVSAFTWYWEGILKPVFELFGAIISWLWENVAKPYFRRIQEGWQKLSDALVSAWENHIWPMIESFGDFIVGLYQNYVKPALDWIVDAWNWVKDTIVSLWENHIKPAYIAQGEFALKLYNDYIKPAIDWIAEKWGWVKDAIVRLWEKHIKPAYLAQGEFALKLYNDYIKPALDWISEKWEWLTGKIGDTWGTIKGHLSDFGSFVKEDVPQMVRDGVDMIDKAWRKVANFFREPINSVIDFVWNDGIKSMFDGVAKAVNSDARLAAIPRIPAFAEGGAVRGRGTGTSDDILAKLSNGEHVLTAAEVEAIGGHDKVYELRKRIKAGEDISPEMSRRLAGNNPSEAMLPMGGVWGWATDAFSSVVDWTRGFLAERAEELIKPIRDGVDGYATEYGPMGKLGGGLINWGLDEVMKWVRGKDEEATSSGGGYEFTGPMVSGGVHRPARGVITSPYGMRWGRLHGGVDFAGPRGTPTFAAWDGVVHSIQNYAQGSGLSVNLSHGGGKYSHYGHNDYGGIPVRAGQSVKAGQRIGNMGMTGNTTGPHLHFETWQGGLWNRRNPNALFGVGGARSNGGLFRDKGGLLPPGVSSVLNNTGGNEYISNQRQFDNLTRMAERLANGAGGGDTFIQNVHNMGSPYQDGADFKRHVSRARRAVSV